MKDLPGSLGKEHIIQNTRKNGVLCLCLLIKRKPYQRRGCLGLQHHLTVLPWLCSPSSVCLARRMLWVNHFGKLWNMCHLNILTALAGPSRVCALMQDLGTWFKCTPSSSSCSAPQLLFQKPKAAAKGTLPSATVPAREEQSQSWRGGERNTQSQEGGDSRVQGAPARGREGVWD